MQQYQEKRQKGKNEEKERLMQKGKPPTPTQATDAHMGKEEKNRKQNKETESRSPTQIPGLFGHLIDPHGSYGGFILKPPPTQGR